MTLESAQRKRRIFLVGFMGSGKSTVGPILANTLGYEFVDIDRAIEQKAGKPILQIFETEGERGFRQIERETLRHLVTLNNCVISLGGGTITNEENFTLVRQNGIMVYLQLSFEEVLKRVQHRSDRPMLRDERGMPLSGEALRARVVQLLHQREEFYRRADIIVPTDHKRVGITVDEIVKKLRPWL